MLTSYQLDISAMRFLYHRQKTQLLCVLVVFIVPIASVPIVKQSVQELLCNLPNQNCTFLKHSTVSPTPPSSPIDTLLRTVSTMWPTTPIRTNPQLIPSGTAGDSLISSSLVSTTSHPRLSTSTSSYYDLDSFTENIKRAAIILAAVAVGLGILRVCLMFCKSSANNSSRSSSTVRPQNGTAEHTVFKPDLPPAYADAISREEHRGGKLPTYDDLPSEQQQPYFVHNQSEITTVQL